MWILTKTDPFIIIGGVRSCSDAITQDYSDLKSELGISLGHSTIMQGTLTGEMRNTDCHADC